MASAVLLVGWALRLVVEGPAAGSSSWTPGLFTGSVTYAAFLCGRFVFRRAWQRPALKYSALAIAFLAFCLDVGVYVRTLAGIKRF